jgi:hypothetical protein
MRLDLLLVVVRFTVACGCFGVAFDVCTLYLIILKMILIKMFIMTCNSIPCTLNEARPTFGALSTLPSSS